MRDLSVTLVQSALAWQEPATNRAQFDRVFAGLAPTDLVLLPEMFSTGFTMTPSACAESLDGVTIAWLRDHAARLGAAIGGSLAMTHEGGYVNRFVLVQPDGRLHCYDKRHLFTLAGEHRRYLAGSERVTIEVCGWRLAPFVCYDLRFPVWCRRPGDCDLMVFVANWPAPRHLAWATLLRARAIENQCCVAGVNRVGEDANGHRYLGGSAAIDALGATIVDAGEVAGVHRVSLSAADLREVRETLPFYRDADAFDLRGP